MIPWSGSTLYLIPEEHPDEVAVVSLFEEGPYDDGTRALRSWFVETSAQMTKLRNTLDELIAEDREQRPSAVQYPLTYSATLVPKTDRLDPEGIRDTFRRLIEKPNPI